MRVFIYLVLASCTPNPTHDRAVERLGESSAKEDGLHRAGQPCLTCHGKDGPADSVFSIGGTITGATGVKVEMVDSVGTSPPAFATNCSGNFWVPAATWTPVFPIVSVKLSKDGVTKAMESVIGGAGSCADCHQTNPNPLAKVGPVVFEGDGGCP